MAGGGEGVFVVRGQRQLAGTTTWAAVGQASFPGNTLMVPRVLSCVTMNSRSKRRLQAVSAG